MLWSMLPVHVHGVGEWTETASWRLPECRSERRTLCSSSPQRLISSRLRLTSKSELQAEINALKTQLDSPSTVRNHIPSLSSPTSGEASSNANISSVSQVSPPSASLQGLLHGINDYPIRDEPMQISPTLNPSENQHGLESTVSRILNDLAVSETEINECFAEYEIFAHICIHSNIDFRK